jgi:glycerol kinase
MILALDQGTTSSRAILFDRNGAIKAVAQKEFPQIFPKPGWVEHNPNDIWSTQAGVAAEAIANAGISPRDVAAIGITNQRETTLVWDRKTGTPVCNAIVWQDRRTAKICDDLKKKRLERLIAKKTGLVIDSYFSAPKLKWILENIPGAKAKARRGDLVFGTVDSWLVWNLTGGKRHITDATNASRTMLLNIHTGDWDEELLEIFGIPRTMLPEVCSSSEVYGQARLFSDEIPVSGIAGDQQAALFGQACTSPGMAKNTYGTGCFMLMHTGTKAVTSKNRLLTTIAWKLGYKIEYALEGSIFIAGAVVQWLRDGLGIIKQSSEIEELASRVSDTGGVYLVPAFAGLGAPHWNESARGLICGLTRGTNASHLARAALEGIALQVVDVLRAMEADTGIRLKELRVDGGASLNNLLLQMQADLLNRPVVRPKISETTALGAAYLAGLGVGFWKDKNELRKHWQQDRVFKPQMKPAARQATLQGWSAALDRTVK